MILALMVPSVLVYFVLLVCLVIVFYVIFVSIPRHLKWIFEHKVSRLTEEVINDYVYDNKLPRKGLPVVMYHAFNQAIETSQSLTGLGLYSFQTSPRPTIPALIEKYKNVYLKQLKKLQPEEQLRCEAYLLAFDMHLKQYIDWGTPTGWVISSLKWCLNWTGWGERPFSSLDTYFWVQVHADYKAKVNKSC